MIRYLRRAGHFFPTVQSFDTWCANPTAAEAWVASSRGGRFAKYSAPSRVCFGAWIVVGRLYVWLLLLLIVDFFFFCIPIPFLHSFLAPIMYTVKFLSSSTIISTAYNIFRLHMKSVMAESENWQSNWVRAFLSSLYRVIDHSSGEKIKWYTLSHMYGWKFVSRFYPWFCSTLF